MTLNRIARWLALGLGAGAAWLAFSAPAEAIPLFARQTGHNCQACHISYPELTAYGREFKLNGYTFGESQPIPLAAALMAQYDMINDNVIHNGTGPSLGPNCTSCNHGEIIQYSVFFGGKLAENFGMFGQFSGAEFPVSGGAVNSATFAGNPAAPGSFTPVADNTEFRYVHRFSSGSGTLEPDTVVGININNNLTMQDVWNNVPAWRYPNGGGGIAYNISGGMGASGAGPVWTPFIDGGGAPLSSGQREIGIGVYTWWHKTVYAELSLYRAPWGAFSWLAWGQNEGGANNPNNPNDMPSDVLANYNPYYRLAYSHDWGYNSIEVGVFGISAHTYNCNPSSTACVTNQSATNGFRDVAFDAQYQYNKGEPWVFSVQTSYEHESNDLTAWLNSTPGVMSTPSHTINEFNINGRAYYDRKYGINAGYSMISGSNDAILYGSNAAGPGLSNTGSPNSSWWTVELNYLPLQDIRFTLQYVMYTKLNGGNSNFDGLGNNATGQNHLTAAIWWVF